ncbi:hypothetical protein CSW30_13240 [Thermus scotoductus]|uniref:Terminase large subunit gp17-like C-terminal domain-containing protein n=1 Tax=Thermus scotoductus TaxID=37636 RepID=A0A430UL70_THESC|nr:hypothetical protein CSW30_13240 [Thermus scotoductus]
MGGGELPVCVDLGLGAAHPSYYFGLQQLTPDPWQREVMRMDRDTLVLAGRQVGKSTVAAAIALHRAVNTRGTVLVMAPTERQSTELVARVRRMALEARLRPEAEGRTYLELAGGGRIIALPANPEGVRGYTATLIVFDEAAYIPDELYLAARPMLAVTRGHVLAISTPAGRRGWFWREWHEGGEYWHRVRVSAFEVGRFPPDFLEGERRRLGERMFRQEYLVEFVEERQGALWRWEWFERPGFRVDTPPDLVRVAVGVDPAASMAEGSAETGIVVAGLGADGHYYVLGDYSLRGSPEEWRARVLHAYHAHQADMVVAERNQGGDMVAAIFRAANMDLPLRLETATRGKAIRAEPVALLYEQGKVHHVGAFRELETQLTGWAPGDPTSPDRMDALVWAMTYLMNRPAPGLSYEEQLRWASR